MVDRDEDADAGNRFAWFSAGAITVIVALGVFLFGGNLLFPSNEAATNTPEVIIEAP